MNMLKSLQSFNRCAPFKPFECIKRSTAENGLDVLNGLNHLNFPRS